jgi:hypothetical protein
MFVQLGPTTCMTTGDYYMSFPQHTEFKCIARSYLLHYSSSGQYAVEPTLIPTLSQLGTACSRANAHTNYAIPAQDTTQ